MNIIFPVLEHNVVADVTCFKLAQILGLLGHNTFRYILDTNNLKQTRIEEVRKIFTERHYDIAIIVNHTRAEFGGAIPDSMRVFTWCQDMCEVFKIPRIKELWHESNDFIFGYTDELRHNGYNTDRLVEFPMPITIEDAHTDVKRNKDFVFVGNKGAFIHDIFYKKIIPLYPEINVEKMQDFIIRLFQHYDDSNMISSIDTLREFSHGAFDNIHFRDAQDEYKFWAMYMFWRVNDAVCRQTVLKWLVDSKRELNIFGDYWDENSVFKNNYRGFIQDRRTLSEVYKAHKYALHINSMGCYHSRPFEILCSGGIPLIYTKNKVERKEFDSKAHMSVQNQYMSWTLAKLIEGKKFEDRVIIESLRNFLPYCKTFASRDELLSVKAQ